MSDNNQVQGKTPNKKNKNKGKKNNPNQSENTNLQEKTPGSNKKSNSYMKKQTPVKSNTPHKVGADNFPDYLHELEANHRNMEREALSKLDRIQNGESTTPLKHHQNSYRKNQSRTPSKNLNQSHNQNQSGDRNRKDNRFKLPEIKFEKYISHDEYLEGVKTGELMEGILRINPRDYNTCFITSSIVGDRDIYMEGISSRNRALEGDKVAVRILPKDEWKTFSLLTGKQLDNDKNSQGESNISQSESDKSGEKIKDNEETYVVKTGKVVYIIDKKHSRVTTGHLNIFRNNAFGFALMSPVDSRLPRLMIPLNECPDSFRQRPKDFEKTLFVAHITNWNLNMAFASGKLVRSLGEAGHIEPETEAILINNSIDSSPFNEDVIDCLPNGEKWSISQDEISKRRDLRKECIFTIDPATARDLDDALSCVKLDDEHYQVGVHIADVSYFIEQGNALDKEASSRATSVYLSQKVIPMLPSILCEQLCSLNPGVERLAYSVIWKLKHDGTVLEEWFGRSVIRSCTKLSYNHAQQLIDSENVNELNTEDFPDIDGKFTLETITEKVKSLYGISKYLRDRRFENGALRLDQPKLSFTLDDESKQPNGCQIYEYRDSNRMIEEFMLLANMAVAHKIYKHHPDRAVLRCHPPPHPAMMADLSRLCKQYNIPFDISNSSSISKSLTDIVTGKIEGIQHVSPALIQMCTKPFQNAKYFCTGSVEDESAYRHYALNVPIYTHFTSPIRRYPDVLVHRFLTSSLNKDFKVKGEIKELQEISNHCNDKKSAAKKASEQSSELFFNAYVMECGPLIEKGIVVGVLSKAVDVLCTKLGVTKRVYCEKLSLYKHDYETELLQPKLTLYWQNVPEIPEGATPDERIALLTAQLEAKWALQNDEGKGDVPIPEDAVKQVLTLFTPVEIEISVDKSAPNKLITLLKSPFDKGAVPLEI